MIKWATFCLTLVVTGHPGDRLDCRVSGDGWFSIQRVEIPASGEAVVRFPDTPPRGDRNNVKMDCAPMVQP